MMIEKHLKNKQHRFKRNLKGVVAFQSVSSYYTSFDVQNVVDDTTGRLEAIFTCYLHINVI